MGKSLSAWEREQHWAKLANDPKYLAENTASEVELSAYREVGL